MKALAVPSVLLAVALIIVAVIDAAVHIPAGTPQYLPETFELMKERAS